MYIPFKCYLKLLMCCFKKINNDVLSTDEKTALISHPIDSNGKLNKKVSYCGKCGSNIRNQKYCSNCGSKLIWIY